ncbi:uncharacterized protein LOC129585841 [Paramacrobiotus metropolitanus]|uniref:uncharacterized protein LOC129585841 n=1 Tax=Paramacrobiotus metropolitanus TaxID=2943436 RepID=UPI0024461113|nr:uncharacterized protein LOC129585841 [Paramacrobiotus metropolitanus]
MALSSDQSSGAVGTSGDESSGGIHEKLALESEEVLIREASLPLHNLFNAVKGKHRIRIINPLHLESFKETFRDKAPSSQSIFLTGIIDAQPDGTLDKDIIQAVKENRIPVYIIDGNHRLRALKELAEEKDSTWSEQSEVLVKVYKPLSKYAGMRLARQKAESVNNQRQETIWDLCRLFRDICFMHQEDIGDESVEVNNDKSVVINCNRKIAAVTSIQVRKRFSV